MLIPTRNRARLAAAALASVASQVAADTRVTVSDNSDEVGQRRWLEEQVNALADPRVTYLSAPAAMSMTDHWTWALDAVLAGSPASHLTFLTDRMVLKPDWLRVISDLVAAYPEEIISYNHDRIDDSRRPIRVEAVEWSGYAYRVPSRRLIVMGSRAESHPALPRMMNCVVPRQAIERVRARFGSVFASISPDHAFAYRTLSVTPSIIYFDAAPLIHYALDRSHGASYERGVASPDRTDFANKLGSTRMNHLAPLPEVQTIMNAVVHEYCFVRAELGDDAFPPVDMSHYLTAMWVGIDQLEDDDLRRTMKSLLRQHDRVVRGRVVGHRVLRRFMAAFHHPARSAHRGLERLTRAWARLAPDARVWCWARARGLLTDGPGVPGFNSTADALRWAGTRARPRNRLGTHLMHLLTNAEMRDRFVEPQVSWPYGDDSGQRLVRGQPVGPSDAA